MPERKRVLVIGLDGATWDVLERWIADGSLPHLAQLRKNGCWGELSSTIPPVSAAAWSSFMTGKRPGKHGVFHFMDLFGDDDVKDSKTKIVNARNLKSPTLWDILGHHGRQVALVNLPMTYPPRPVNGFMITGLLTPSDARTFTYPPELSRELTDYVIDLDRFIDAKPFQIEKSRRVEAPSLSLVKEFQEMMVKRATTGLSLIKSRPWDVFVIVFTGTDRMGHYLWPFHRSADPSDSPETRDLCQAVHQYYVRLDEAVGELVSTAGEDVNVIVMSDHGMGPNNTKRMHWNVWLQKQGWLTAKPAGARIGNPEHWFRRIGLSRDKLGRVVKRAPWLLKMRPVKQAIQRPYSTVDVDRSQAYCVPIFRTVTGIRINLKNDKKEALFQEITTELEKVIDSDTDTPVVQRVCRGQDYYTGPYAENVPDIIVCMKPEYGCSYRLGHYSSVVSPVQIPQGRGNHRYEGIFIANGPDVMPNAEPLTGMTIEDIAPTILYILNLPIPSDMDGRVSKQVLRPDALESRPIRSCAPMGLWPNADEAVFLDAALSGAGERLVRQRLAALGYLD